MPKHAPNHHKTAYDKRNLLQLPTEIQAHINQGAIVYTSHSAGKDSQAMYNYLTTLIPHQQIVLVYADLGNIVWEGTRDHIHKTARHPLHTVRANKTLFDMVRHRAKTRPDVPSWPSHAYRQCTSDLKVAPIYKFIRHNMKSKKATLAINAVGLRAEESTGRAKRNPWTLNKTLSKAGPHRLRLVPDFQLDRRRRIQLHQGMRSTPILDLLHGQQTQQLCILHTWLQQRPGQRIPAQAGTIQRIQPTRK